MFDLVEPGNIVRVYWIDSYAMTGWQDLTPAVYEDKHANCQTVGWYYGHNEDYAVIAGSMSGVEGNGVIAIPLIAVTDIEILASE